jgi:hypothetical protein
MDSQVTLVAGLAALGSNTLDFRKDTLAEALKGKGPKFPKDLPVRLADWA